MSTCVTYFLYGGVWLMLWIKVIPGHSSFYKMKKFKKTENRNLYCSKYKFERLLVFSQASLELKKRSAHGTTAVKGSCPI